MDGILNYFPEILKQKIKKEDLIEIEEIRLRTEKPVILKNSTDETILDYIISQETMLQILQKVCDNSLYSYQNQICEGFITVKGGHRIRYHRKCGYKGWKSNKFKLYK